MRRCGVLRARYASSVIERARRCILQFDKDMSSAAYDETFNAVECDLVRYKESKLPIVAIGECGRLRFLNHRESESIIECMLSEIVYIRKQIAFYIWMREKRVHVI